MVHWFLTKVPKQFNGDRKVFSTYVAGRTGYPLGEGNEPWSLPHTIGKKINLKWDHRPKCKSWNDTASGRQQYLYDLS